MKKILALLLITGIVTFLFAGKAADNANNSSQQGYNSQQTHNPNYSSEQAQNSNSSQQADSLFVVIYTTGSQWDVSKTADQQPYFNDHSAFMMKLRKEATTLLGARYSDKGMLVIKSASLQQAQHLISSDKAIIHKTFNAEVHPVNFFFTGCVK